MIKEIGEDTVEDTVLEEDVKSSNLFQTTTLSFVFRYSKMIEQSSRKAFSSSFQIRIQ